MFYFDGLPRSVFIRMVFWVGAVDILNELNAARIFNGSVAFGYDDAKHVAGDTSCCLD